MSSTKGFKQVYFSAVIFLQSFCLTTCVSDVNECGTQLVLCDISADCVNQFGTYSCHCRPGFRDESRLGTGGTVCVDTKPAGIHALGSTLDMVN